MGSAHGYASVLPERKASRLPTCKGRQKELRQGSIIPHYRFPTQQPNPCRVAHVLHYHTIARSAQHSMKTPIWASAARALPTTMHVHVLGSQNLTGFFRYPLRVAVLTGSHRYTALLLTSAFLVHGDQCSLFAYVHQGCTSSAHGHACMLSRKYHDVCVRLPAGLLGWPLPR